MIYRINNWWAGSFISISTKRIKKKSVLNCRINIKYQVLYLQWGWDCWNSTGRYGTFVVLEVVWPPRESKIVSVWWAVDSFVWIWHEHYLDHREWSHVWTLYRSEGKKMSMSRTGCVWVPPTDVFQRSGGFKGAKNDTITAKVACKRILIRLQRPLGDSGPFGKHFDEEDDHQQLQPLDMENGKHMRSMGFSDGLIMMPLVPWNTTSFEPQNPSYRPAQHERRRSASPLGMWHGSVLHTLKFNCNWPAGTPAAMCWDSTFNVS